MSRMLAQVYLKDYPALSTKWKRIYRAFIDYQNKNIVPTK